ncbi:N/A [soil metagenome]
MQRNVSLLGTHLPFRIGMQNHASSPSRTVAGFTLIELVTTLLIFGILAGIAAPKMNTYIERQKTRRVLDTVATDLAQARILAIRQGSRVDVQLHSSNHYSVGVVGSSNRKEVRLAQTYPGVALVMPAPSIVFDSRGLVRSGNGAITVSINGKTDALDLSVTGRVYRAY